MPEVDGKHFAYSEKGKNAAKREAKRTGKALQYGGANQRRHPKKRGQPFHPSDMLVSMTMR